MTKPNKTPKTLTTLLLTLAITLALALGAALTGPHAAQASADVIKIYVDEKLIQTDVPPYIKSERTMVPIRFVSEALGAEVSWNDLTQGVTIKSSKTTIKMTIGLLKGWVAKLTNPETETTYDMAPEKTGGRTFVPLRFVSENLGATVKWDAAAKVVNIYSEGFTPTPAVEGKKVGDFTVPACLLSLPVEITGPHMVVDEINNTSYESDVRIDFSAMRRTDLTEERIKAINTMIAEKYEASVGDQAEKMVRSGLTGRLIPDWDIPGTKDYIATMCYGGGWSVSIAVLRH